MIVHVEDVQIYLKRLQDINDLDFDDITWMKGDTLIRPTAKEKKEWKELGLLNSDFISSNKYLECYK